MGSWEGAIFAKAGLERLELVGSYFQELKWMIPAPAQGAIGIVCRADENELIKQLQKINHQPHKHNEPKYGAKIQYAEQPDASPKLGKEETKFIQQVTELSCIMREQLIQRC